MESNALRYFCVTFTLLSRYFLNMSRAWLFVFNTISSIYSKCKSLSHQNSVMNKPQAEERVNSRLYSRTKEKKVQHSSAIKIHEAQLLVHLKSFLLISMVELDHQRSASKTLFKKRDYIHLCCLAYLIIAGLRHILSLHFTVLIHFDEYWISFLRVRWINTHSHLV